MEDGPVPCECCCDWCGDGRKVKGEPCAYCGYQF